VYAGDHPPVMSWLLGLADALEPGAALFVALDAALIFGALIALVLVGGRGSWLGPPLAVLLVMFPQLAVYPAIVWKDVLFAGAMIAGFTALAWAAASWSRPGRRNLLLAAALALLALAALARQNGALVLPIAALAAGWIALRAGEPLRRAAGWGAGFLAAAAMLTAVGAMALATRLDGTPALAQAWEGLELYDIVAAKAREPGLDLGVLHARAPDFESLVRSRGVAVYTPVRLDPLEPLAERIQDRRDASDLAFSQWRELVVRHPLLYLETRAEAFRWVFLTPRPDDCVMVETGVDGPADAMTVARLVPRKDARDDALESYALAFAQTPVYRHGAYAALGALLLIPLLRRRRGPDLAVAAMLASAGAFAASFFVISIACDYRYLYALDAAVIAAGLYVASSFGGRGSAGRGGRFPPTSEPRRHAL
jgi:hypothetical protein